MAPIVWNENQIWPGPSTTCWHDEVIVCSLYGFWPDWKGKSPIISWWQTRIFSIPRVIAVLEFKYKIMSFLHFIILLSNYFLQLGKLGTQVQFLIFFLWFIVCSLYGFWPDWKGKSPIISWWQTRIFSIRRAIPVLELKDSFWFNIFLVH